MNLRSRPTASCWKDLYFGPFEIRLDWRQLGSATPYRVVALDPHPAAKDTDVTHPHVQEEQLCEGEGRSAVRAALAEGRLYDFFLLVSQLLHTYGRGSAYVELDNWDGIPCDDCNAPVRPRRPLLLRPMRQHTLQ